MEIWVIKVADIEVKTGHKGAPAALALEGVDQGGDIAHDFATSIPKRQFDPEPMPHCGLRSEVSPLVMP